MAGCDGKVGRAHARPATWRQDIHAAKGDRGPFLYHAHWCAEHAERIKEKLRVEWGAPPKMVQFAAVRDE